MAKDCVVRVRDAMIWSLPVGGRRRIFGSPTIFSDVGLVIIQLFLVLSSITGNDLPFSSPSLTASQTSSSTPLDGLSTSVSTVDEGSRRTTGLGIVLADGYSMTGSMSLRSRLMPRYECCCQNCPRRPCFICRNIDYSCNCASCSCYADPNPSQTTTPADVLEVSADEDDAVPVVPVHRVRHQRYRPSGHHRGHKMAIDLGVTSSQSNAFIDRLLQRHPGGASSSKTPGDRERT